MSPFQDLPRSWNRTRPRAADWTMRPADHPVMGVDLAERSSGRAAAVAPLMDMVRTGTLRAAKEFAWLRALVGTGRRPQPGVGGFVVGDEQRRRRLLLRLALALDEKTAAPTSVLDLGSGDGRRPGHLAAAGESVLVAGADGVFAFVTEGGRNLGPADDEGICRVADLLAEAASHPQRTRRRGRARRRVRAAWRPRR